VSEPAPPQARGWRRLLAWTRSPGRPVGWSLLSLGWLLLVVGGLAGVWRFENTAAAPAEPPATWPAESRIFRAPGRPLLLMLAHPRCACTRASLGELARLMTRVGDKLSATVVFVRPPGTEAAWIETDTWRTASSIPGVTVLRDDGGVEAARFRANTSGSVLLYGAGGRLQFNGGITLARGHAGDNPGADRIATLVTGGTPERATAPAFGCALADDPSGGGPPERGAP
jgi:hypothetical protein